MDSIAKLYNGNINKDIKIYYLDSLSQSFSYLPFDIYDYIMKINFKNHSSGFYMNWHIDDCVRIKKKHNTNFILKNNSKIFYENDKFILLYYNKLPSYTLLYYSNVDSANGGYLLFPGLKIKPKNNMMILFPSHIPHCVSKLNSGIRKNVIIKFYKK